MASGYEKSKDYGGPPFKWRDILLIVAFWIIVIGIIVAALA